MTETTERTQRTTNEPVFVADVRGVARAGELGVPTPRVLEPHPWLSAACDVGCCLVVVDPQLRSPRRTSMVERPMFQVLVDEGSWSSAGDVHPDSECGMRVPAAEYDRPGRVFL